MEKLVSQEQFRINVFCLVMIKEIFIYDGIFSFSFCSTGCIKTQISVTFFAENHRYCELVQNSKDKQKIIMKFLHYPKYRSIKGLDLEILYVTEMIIDFSNGHRTRTTIVRRCSIYLVPWTCSFSKW